VRRGTPFQDPLEVQFQVFQATVTKFGRDKATEIWDQALTYCHFNLHDSSLVHRRIGKPQVNDANETFDSFADFCQHYNLGILAAAPLSMGLLTHHDIAEWHPALGTKLELACQNAAEICRSHNIDIATLAILFALSHPKVPCTILGMKDIQQVEFASSLARRFNNIDWTNPELRQEDVLQQVLTEGEMLVFQILTDQRHGPFAGLHETDITGTVPMYQWDGVKEVHKFWKAIDGAKFEEWQWR
jgi:hypothetical protein